MFSDPFALNGTVDYKIHKHFTPTSVKNLLHPYLP